MAGSSVTDEAPDDGASRVLGDKVVEYRRGRFEFYGLDAARALLAAATRGGAEQGYAIDLHVFAGLVEAGASADAAYRILAPL